MKRHILLGATLLSLLAAGCSNEGILDNGTEDVLDNDNEALAGKTITLQADIVDDFGTRMTYEDDASNKVLKFNWSSNDRFNLYQGTSSTAAEFSKTESGNTFTGTAPSGGTGTYYAVYGNDITNADGVLTADISTQTGTTAENGITHFMVAETKYLAQATGLQPTLNFVHKLAVLKLTLTLPSEAEGTVPSVTLSGLHNKATYTLADGKYAYENTNIGDIIAANGSDGFTITDHKITAYVAVFPEEVDAYQMVIYANAGDNKYMYTLKSAKTLTAGKVIPVNVSMNYNYEDYECVDLGLSSHTKWATCNVGAKNPSEYGDYYAWGETETKSEYSWSTYMGGKCNERDCGTDNDPLKDYVNNKKSIAGTEFDVAHMKWGGTWKMPTKAQLEELYNEENCSHEWKTNYNGSGKNGWLFTSLKTGYTSNSIFLPAAGYRYDSLLDVEGSYGDYWSATPYSDNTNDAYNLFFNLNNISWNYGYRYVGQSVRPVYVPDNITGNENPPTMGNSDEWN